MQGDSAKNKIICFRVRGIPRGNSIRSCTTTAARENIAKELSRICCTKCFNSSPDLFIATRTFARGAMSLFQSMERSRAHSITSELLNRCSIRLALISRPDSQIRNYTKHLRDEWALVFPRGFAPHKRQESASSRRREITRPFSETSLVSLDCESMQRRMKGAGTKRLPWGKMSRWLNISRAARTGTQNEKCRLRFRREQKRYIPRFLFVLFSFFNKTLSSSSVSGRELK